MNEIADKGENRLHILVALEQEQMHTAEKQGNAVSCSLYSCDMAPPELRGRIQKLNMLTKLSWTGEV